MKYIGLMLVMLQLMCFKYVFSKIGNKALIKLDDIEDLIKTKATECYPPKVKQKEFLANMTIALSTGKLNSTSELKCFMHCVLKNYDILSTAEGTVNNITMKGLVANFTHEPLKEIFDSNLETCAATTNSVDPCLNALKYSRCFVQHGALMYIKAKESFFPKAKKGRKSFFDKFKKNTTTTTKP